MTAEPPEIRIGDRQRRATDDRLRAALDDGVLTLTEYDERSRQCFAARVQRDLDALVADLPAPNAPEPATPAPASATPVAPARQQQPWFHRLGRVVVPIVVLGAVVFGGTRVTGADDGFAVFGSRVVPVAAGQERVEVASLFGSTEVVVPDGTVVQQSGYLVFGSIRCEDACRVPPGAPSERPVTVDAGGAFGSVQIVTATEAAQGGLRDRDDDD
ncbi:DUF1707 domain-containing protein [Actinomycetospora chlora]|uniref:DUF1707 SHOCT-like domain-containing protein n=1 Tax=Actinomycetospora chlora TaxID=663608 RepID=UPI0031E775E4